MQDVLDLVRVVSTYALYLATIPGRSVGSGSALFAGMASTKAAPARKAADNLENSMLGDRSVIDREARSDCYVMIT